jgi:hypothetical protein
MKFSHTGLVAEDASLTQGEIGNLFAEVFAEPLHNVILS